MHVIVVGCGRVGAELAVGLDHGGHDVAVIDKRNDAFRRLPSDFSGRTVHGFGFDRDHLEAAGVHQAQALAAVTSGDNSNILAARIARETYEIPPRRRPDLRPPARRDLPAPRDRDRRDRRLDDRSGDAPAVRGRERDRVVRAERPGGARRRALPSAWAGHTLAALADDERFRLVSVTRAGQATLAAPASRTGGRRPAPGGAQGGPRRAGPRPRSAARDGGPLT